MKRSAAAVAHVRRVRAMAVVARTIPTGTVGGIFGGFGEGEDSQPDPSRYDPTGPKQDEGTPIDECSSSGDCQPCQSCLDTWAGGEHLGNRCTGVPCGGPPAGTCQYTSECPQCYGCAGGECVYDGRSNNCPHAPPVEQNWWDQYFDWRASNDQRNASPGDGAESGSNIGWWIAGGATVIGIGGLVTWLALRK